MNSIDRLKPAAYATGMSARRIDPRIYVTVALFREMCGASELITSGLRAAGFADIPGETAMVLAAAESGHHPVDDLLPKLGISGQATSQMIDTLISRGYLRRGGKLAGQHEQAIALTRRGYALAHATMDSLCVARWAGFEPRRGDIVINTPLMGGTTWLQMICALLIFQTPDLPAPMPALSPYLESGKDAWARLTTQEHRRFMKTHLPLGEIPSHSQVIYLAVARDPLDAAMSLHHHEKVLRSRRGGEDADTPRIRQQDGQAWADRPDTPREWLLQWIDSDDIPQVRRQSLAGVMWHLSQAWARRSEPNVILVHYEDLCADLEGRMRCLANQLGITVPEAAWPGLVKAARSEQMRSAADAIQPPMHQLSGDPATFVQRGTSGAARELLSSDDLAHYHARAAQLAPPGLVAWLHRQDQPA